MSSAPEAGGPSIPRSPGAPSPDPAAPGPSGDRDAGDHPIDEGAAYELAPLVSVRSERFGALLYHGGSRRLLFLRVVGLGDLLLGLGEYRSAAELLATLPDRERRPATAALGALLAAGFIRVRNVSGR